MYEFEVLRPFFCLNTCLVSILHNVSQHPKTKFLLDATAFACGHLNGQFLYRPRLCPANNWLVWFFFDHFSEGHCVSNVRVQCILAGHSTCTVSVFLSANNFTCAVFDFCELCIVTVTVFNFCELFTLCGYSFVFQNKQDAWWAVCDLKGLGFSFFFFFFFFLCFFCFLMFPFFSFFFVQAFLIIF